MITDQTKVCGAAGGSLVNVGGSFDHHDHLHFNQIIITITTITTIIIIVIEQQVEV